MEDSFICCICKYKGLSQFDLQAHIDNSHSNNTGPERVIDIEVDKDGNITLKTLCTKYGIKGNNLSQFVIFLENDVPSYLIILIKPKQYQNQINTNT